jgi:crossover junction endodeoxyribonuclease RuvC
MIIGGIDPGLTGAIARFDAVTGALLAITDMPVFELVKAGKRSKIIDAYRLVDLLGQGYGHIFVEVAQTRPGQAAQAVAKCFVGYGIILGVIAALGVPITHVQPRTWKNSFKVPASKDGARARASELIRGGAVHWPLVKHDGRAEASLIALWGIRTLNVTGRVERNPSPIAVRQSRSAPGFMTALSNCVDRWSGGSRPPAGRARPAAATRLRPP